MIGISSTLKIRKITMSIQKFLSQPPYYFSAPGWLESESGEEEGVKAEEDRLKAGVPNPSPSAFAPASLQPVPVAFSLYPFGLNPSPSAHRQIVLQSFQGLAYFVTAEYLTAITRSCVRQPYVRVMNEYRVAV